MYQEFDHKFDLRALDAEEADNEDTCPGAAPRHRGVMFVCTLTKVHELPHLAGLGNGFIAAEWDDDRSTDIFE